MFTIECRLKATNKQEFYLDKVFDVKRKICNDIFKYVIKKINKMVKTDGIGFKKIYKNNSLSKTQKNKQISNILKSYRLTESCLHSDLKWLSKHYCINSSLLQK